MDHTHSTGPHLKDDVLFPFAFHLCFLSLILMRTDLGVEPSTRWKYQIRPSGDRTPRGRRSIRRIFVWTMCIAMLCSVGRVARETIYLILLSELTV
eukprot:scaffold22393_cov66-Phaeocystis_antarctica.AAC.1